VNISTVNALSACDVLRKLVAVLGWKEVKTRGGDKVDIDWFDRVAGEGNYATAVREGQNGSIRIKPFPGMPDLCNKVGLAKLLSRMQRLFPAQFSTFHPETIDLSEDDVTRYLSGGSHSRDLISMLGEGEMASQLGSGKGEQVCIVKPADGTQGAGIFLVRKWQDLEAILPLLRSGGVIQRYIPNPLLENGYKFDLRVYVLITSVDPLRVYVCREGLARFCTEKYEDPGQRNTNMLGHLTNYSLNKKSTKFEMAESPYTGDKGTKRTISAYFKKIEREGVDVESLWASMDDVILKTLFSMQPVLADTYRDRFGQDNKGRSCFQVLGFDFLLDTDMKPWLLEINNNPDWSISHQQVYSSGSGRRVNSELDTMVKQTVVCGAIRIVLDDRYAEHKYRDKLKLGMKEEGVEEERRGSISDWGMAEEEGESEKYSYVRVYPLANVDKTAEEAEVDEADAAKVVQKPNALRHLREGDYSELMILDDVRRLHHAVFGQTRERGGATVSQEKLRLRHFVQKSGLIDTSDPSCAQMIDLLLAKMGGAISGIDPLTFCDFLIRLAMRVWPACKTEYEALTKLISRKGMLPSQAKKKLLLQSQFNAPKAATSKSRR